MGVALAALFSFVLAITSPAPLPIAPWLGPIPAGGIGGELPD
jgi:hypothetical protein